MNQPFINQLKENIPSSIIVFLVAIPLCLGIALASEAPLISGIISGIIGGVVIGAISGSALGVSGPAAGLVVIVLAAIQDLDTYSMFLAAVVVSGVLQIILGIVKAGIIGYYFPSSVIKGMLSSIGIIIILKQIPHAVGYDADPEGDLEFFQSDGETTFSELYTMLDYVNWSAVVLFVISMLLLILWEQPFIKKIKAIRLIKGPLVVVVAGILINQLFINTSWYIGSEHLVNLPIAKSFSDFFNQFTFVDINGFLRKEVWITGIIIMVVGSLETLLSVEATDKMDPKKRITPTNRELIAQGIGNTISGTIGGLPITQVIVRSSVNIQSGGTSKLSAIFHGILLFISVITIPNILNKIPLSSLAAILIMVGYKLANPKVFQKVIKLGKSEYIPFFVTVVGIILTDLLIGIVLGLIVGIFEILLANIKQPPNVHITEKEGNKKIKIELSENLTFLNKASIIKTIADIPNDCHVVIDASRTRFMHPDVDEILRDFKENANFRNINLKTINFNLSSEDNIKSSTDK